MRKTSRIRNITREWLLMFQDTNDDETMNSLFGVPLEPYGVSRNAKGFPSFSNTRFKLDKNKKINIKLKN